MTLTPRDRWICAVLPALLAVVLFQWFYAGPLQRQTNESLKALEEERARGTQPAALSDALRLNSAAEADLAAEKAKAEALKAALAKLTIGAGGVNRPATLQSVCKLCERHGLLVVSTRREEQATLARTLEPIARALREQTPSAPPQLWRLELQGGYADMTALLEALSEATEFVVPISVNMNLGEYENIPAVWVLTLWM